MIWWCVSVAALTLLTFIFGFGVGSAWVAGLFERCGPIAVVYNLGLWFVKDVAEDSTNNSMYGGPTLPKALRAFLDDTEVVDV